MDIETATTEDRRGPIPPALKRFIWDIQSIVELADSEREILLIGRDLMARYVAADEALPATFAVASSGGACHQIYADAMARFCVVGAVLSPGAELTLPKGAWEIMGVYSGAIERRAPEAQSGAVLPRGSVETRHAGGGASRLLNASGEGASVAIQVFGGDIAEIMRLCANDAGAPPYDIFSIQTKIED